MYGWTGYASVILGITKEWERGFKNFVSTTGQVTEFILVGAVKPLSFCCVEEIRVHNPMILTSLNNIGRTIGGDHDKK